MKKGQYSNESIGQRALEFTKQLSAVYFEERGLERLTSYMKPQISWIGTGEGELSHNIGDARQILKNELKEYGGKFTLKDCAFETIPLSETLCIVYGELIAVPDNQEFSEERLRVSLVLEWEEGGFKLVHMHFSHADPAQEKGQYFVRQEARTENQTLRMELNAREKQLANLNQNIPGGSHQCANDPGMTILSMSDGFLEMFGYSQEEIRTIFDGQFLNMIYPDDRTSVMEQMTQQLQNGKNLELEYRVFRNGKPPVWILDKGRLVDLHDGTSCFYCILVDITERKQAQEELRLTLERHQIIMDQATDIIFEWDIPQDVLHFSQNWNKRFGYDAVRENISHRIPHSKNIHEADMPAFIKIMKDTAKGVPYSETEFRIRDIAGTYMWCRIRATVQYDANGNPIKAVGVIVDIDEEKRQKQKLIDRAQRDELTGLYNKKTMQTQVEKSLKKPISEGFRVLLMIDVDYFKDVNDTYGHLCGDRLLSAVAQVLEQNTRPCDYVGRIGGDEFLVYLSSVRDEAEARSKAETLLERLQRITPQADAPPITCSIGVVLCQKDNCDYFTLYQCADQALYHRKHHGRSGISIYNEMVQTD